MMSNGGLLSQVIDEEEGLLAFIGSLCVGGLVGVVFGVALQKGGVSEPKVIRKQMSFRSFHMFKLFMMACAVSAILFGLLDAFGSKVSFRRTNLRLNALGGILVGMGMTLSGACPGTVWSQWGAGAAGSMWTLAGGVLASTIEGGVDGSLSFSQHESEVLTLHRIWNVPLYVLGFSFATMCIGMAYLLDVLVPWKEELARYEPAEADMPDSLQLRQKPWYDLSLRSSFWNPLVCGALIGSLQLPVQLVFQSSLGTSAALLTFCAACCAGYANPYMTKCRQGARNWWMPAMVVGIAIGSYLSSKASRRRKESSSHTRSPSTTVRKTHPFVLLLGGFLLIFGSRMAGGCTSGQGLSGMGQLSVGGFVTTAAIFAGGYIQSLIYMPK